MPSPKIVADFEVQLASAIAIGATSFTLSSVTDDDGNTIPNGLYYFTIDNGSSAKEYVSGTVSGTSVTSVKNVSRQGAETSGTARAHRAGASVIITDFATYKEYIDAISSNWSAPVANFAALPSGSEDGEVRVTLDDSKIYVYDADTTTWYLAGAGGGAGTVYITTKLGDEAEGGDNVTFTLNSGSFPEDKYLQVYVNGILMEVGASEDYTTTGGNTVVFNDAVLDTDKITLLVISVDLYNPEWNNVNADILPDLDDAYDIGSPTKQFKDIYLSSLTGIVVPFAGSSAPTGWLMCDGSAVSRTTYANLFGIIGETYGAGDTSTTFNLPDLRSRLPVGAGTAPTKVATFVSRSSNVITVSGISDAANNEFQTGQAVLYSAASGAMTGLTHNTTYYLVRTGNLTFSLASSLANAQNGTVISLSSDGTGTQTFTLTLTARTLGHSGGEENHAMSLTELLAHNHTHEFLQASGGDGAQPAIADSGSALSSSWQTSTRRRNAATGGNTTSNNMQPFLALNYLIKY